MFYRHRQFVAFDPFVKPAVKKMDPMNQSAQISSSQGLADGQNAAPKESKVSGKKWS